MELRLAAFGYSSESRAMQLGSFYKSLDYLMRGHCYASYTGCHFITGLTISWLF